MPHLRTHPAPVRCPRRRDEAARQLRAIADELASVSVILMERDGLPVTVTLPDEVAIEVVVEIEHDEWEFEITLCW